MPLSDDAISDLISIAGVARALLDKDRTESERARIERTLEGLIARAKARGAVIRKPYSFE